MNFKACTRERPALISLGFGRGAEVGKTSFLEVEFIYGASVDVARIHFFIWYASGPGIPPKPSTFGRRRSNYFLQCEAKIVRRHTSRQRSSVASQQRLRSIRFDSTVKRVPKLRFEPDSFLFLVCL